MFFFQEGFSYRNFLMDVLGIFIFVVWFWLLITVFADLFRRHDISGWIKAIWVIALIVFSYIAVLAYLIFQGRGMAERNVQQAQQARDELRRVVGFSAADEIQKLDALKKKNDQRRRICQTTCPARLVTRAARRDRIARGLSLSGIFRSVDELKAFNLGCFRPLHHLMADDACCSIDFAVGNQRRCRRIKRSAMRAEKGASF
jgi:hypothetical protein